MHREPRAPYLLLGGAALAVGLLLLIPLPPGLWHDDGVYLQLGRALARGEGLAYVGVPGDPAAPKFPPLYPALLALLWAVSNNPYGVAQVAAVLNIAFVAAGCAAFAGWARALGAPRAIALAAGALLAFSVALWQTAMVALSEPLFLLLMAGALLLALRVERSGGVRAALALGALLLALVHVRTAGVALAGAAVGGLLARQRVREAAAVAIATALGALPWLLWSGRATAALPPPLRDILGGYGGFLTDRMEGGRELEPDALAASAQQISRSLAGLFLPGVGGDPPGVLAVPIALLVAAGAGALARRSPTGALALVLFVVEAWLWPFQATRLLVPVFPLALVGLACGAADLAAATAERPRARALLAGTGALAALAFAAGSLVRMVAGDVTDRYLIRTRTLADAVTLVEQTPPGAIIGAPELWAVLPMLTGRRAGPSAPFEPDPLGRRPTAGTPIEQLAVWDAAGFDHLLLEDGGRIHGGTLTAVEDACPGTVTIVARTERELLVRLGGDPACRAVVLARGTL